jgi:hypothetical protein
VRTCAREGCPNLIGPGCHNRTLYCCDQCRDLASAHADRLAAATAHKRAYLARKATGRCTKCGRKADRGTKCSMCAEKQRAREVGAGRRRHDKRTAALDPIPQLGCAECCDLPWRRPATGCPACGGEYADEMIEPPSLLGSSCSWADGVVLRDDEAAE